MTTDDLKEFIQRDMIEAMRAKEKDRLSAIRMLMAAIKQREIDHRITLKNTDIIVVIEKMIKQRRESIKQFAAGNRPELVAKEELEITVLEKYLPNALTESEIDTAIEAAIQKTGATHIKDMSKVMSVLKEQLQGRANMGMVSSKVKTRLS